MDDFLFLVSYFKFVYLLILMVKFYLKN